MSDAEAEADPTDPYFHLEPLQAAFPLCTRCAAVVAYMLYHKAGLEPAATVVKARAPTAVSPLAGAAGPGFPAQRDGGDPRSGRAPLPGPAALRGARLSSRWARLKAETGFGGPGRGWWQTLATAALVSTVYWFGHLGAAAADVAMTGALALQLMAVVVEGRAVPRAGAGALLLLALALVTGQSGFLLSSLLVHVVVWGTAPAAAEGDDVTSEGRLSAPPPTAEPSREAVVPSATPGVSLPSGRSSPSLSPASFPSTPSSAGSADDGPGPVHFVSSPLVPVAGPVPCRPVPRSLHGGGAIRRTLAAVVVALVASVTLNVLVLLEAPLPAAVTALLAWAP